MRGHAIAFPILIRPTTKISAAQPALLAEVESPRANLSEFARSYLDGLGIRDPDADAETAGLVWMHALAIGYSPAYLAENADGVRQDWPRVPLPSTAGRFRASAALGRQVAALLDTERTVPGVTERPLRPEIAAFGNIARAGGGTLDPSTDLAVTAGWGHAGKEGVTMPGKGRAIARDYTAAEAGALGEQGIALLGERTLDIYLNATAYWANMPERVWAYTIGGYQVIKKWLSYREAPLLGRPLTVAEAREVTDMARRIAALLLLAPALDENYLACAGGDL